MKTFSFDFWSDLMRCYGGNAGSSATITVDDDEAKYLEDNIR